MFPLLFSLLAPLSQDSYMLCKIATDDEERHDVWFILVHAQSCDAASHTEARMEAVRTTAALLATRHDGGLLQRSFPPMLRCVCLAQRPIGWPTP